MTQIQIAGVPLQIIFAGAIGIIAAETIGLINAYRRHGTPLRTLLHATTKNLLIFVPCALALIWALYRLTGI